MSFIHFSRFFRSKQGIIGDPYCECYYTIMLENRHIILMVCVDGWNDWEERWVAYDNWQYSLTFNLTSDQVTGRTLYLRCGGLDTVANIT